MLTLIPRIHGIQNIIGLMDRPDRTLGKYRQLFIGNNSGHLDNQIEVRIETRHLEIDPNQIIFTFQIVPPSTTTRIVAAESSLL